MKRALLAGLAALLSGVSPAFADDAGPQASSAPSAMEAPASRPFVAPVLQDLQGCPYVRSARDPETVSYRLDSRKTAYPVTHPQAGCITLVSYSR